MADGRLGDADRRGQVAVAHLVRREQQRQKTDADRVGERLQANGYLEGVVLGHRRGCNGRAADRRGRIDHGERLGHEIMLPTFLTYVKEVGNVVIMSRVQLALNVDNLDEAIAFYAKLFGTEPAKRRDGYANFAVTNPPLKLVLLENPGQGGSLNHLGVEVESTDVVDEEQRRLAEVGLASIDERGTTCCYAKQDKFWVEGAPSGERWEIYTVLEDSPTFFSSATDGSDADCCSTESTCC